MASKMASQNRASIKSWAAASANRSRGSEREHVNTSGGKRLAVVRE